MVKLSSVKRGDVVRVRLGENHWRLYRGVDQREFVAVVANVADDSDVIGVSPYGMPTTFVAVASDVTDHEYYGEILEVISE